MELRGKTILIISPNYWGKMMVSKHHYALELAKMGNTVYFLNPPNLQKSYFEKSQIDENLWLIDYKPIFRGKRYLPNCLFNLLVYFQVKFLVSKIKKPLDIVWSFDSSIYLNLKYFRSCFRIFFIADNGEKGHLFKIGKSADLIISVSENLFENLKQFNKKLMLIEHGLAEYFKSVNKAGFIHQSGKTRAAFIGNLFKRALDRKTFKNIIDDNPEVEFVIYGTYKLAESNLSGFRSKESYEFIEYLQNQNNVILKGAVEPEKLSNELSGFDLFLFIENPLQDINQSSNSHKLIEYLSTGKVVVSSHVISYRNKGDLIEMTDEMHNENLPELFTKVVNNLGYYNNKELQNKRIGFALDNTYEKQIDRIEQKINEQSDHETISLNNSF